MYGFTRICQPITAICNYCRLTLQFAGFCRFRIILQDERAKKVDFSNVTQKIPFFALSCVMQPWAAYMQLCLSIS